MSYKHDQYVVVAINNVYMAQFSHYHGYSFCEAGLERPLL